MIDRFSRILFAKVTMKLYLNLNSSFSKFSNNPVSVIILFIPRQKGILRKFSLPRKRWSDDSAYIAQTFRTSIFPLHHRYFWISPPPSVTAQLPFPVSPFPLLAITCGPEQAFLKFREVGVVGNLKDTIAAGQKFTPA